MKCLLVTKTQNSVFGKIVLSFVLAIANAGWVGVDVRPTQKRFRDIPIQESGQYSQLSDDERKELVWMAKAAASAYPDGDKPLGYRSLSKKEWNACAIDCSELEYTEDGFFRIGSGLRGRVMIHMLNEGRIILSLSGCDFALGKDELIKDVKTCVHQYVYGNGEQYEQALRLMTGLLKCRPRTQLWIVGHSLGGSLAAYLALKLPESKTNVKCATFNAYGISPQLSITVAEKEIANHRVRNVYASKDPIYNWTIPVVSSFERPIHLGSSYKIEGMGDEWDQHGLDALIRLMIKGRTAWQGL